MNEYSLPLLRLGTNVIVVRTDRLLYRPTPLMEFLDLINNTIALGIPASTSPYQLTPLNSLEMRPMDEEGRPIRAGIDQHRYPLRRLFPFLDLFPILPFTFIRTNAWELRHLRLNW